MHQSSCTWPACGYVSTTVGVILVCIGRDNGSQGICCRNLYLIGFLLIWLCGVSAASCAVHWGCAKGRGRRGLGSGSYSRGRRA